jgi:DNA-binding NarL/FixJ family response regulator
MSRRGFCEVIASRPNYTVVLALPRIPEDTSILRNPEPEVMLFQSKDGVSDLFLLRALLPDTKILLVLDEADDDVEWLALKAGAWGCVPRGIDGETLFKAFDVVGRGEFWVSHRVATRAIGNLMHTQMTESTNRLTRREWEILASVANGARNKEIANRLSISENTVKTHLLTIYRKIDVDCRLAATLYYFQRSKLNTQLSAGSGSPQPKRGNAAVGAASENEK